jgi:hypothetical protein
MNDYIRQSFLRLCTGSLGARSEPLRSRLDLFSGQRFGDGPECDGQRARGYRARLTRLHLGFRFLKRARSHHPLALLNLEIGRDAHIETTLPRRMQLVAHGQVNPFFWPSSAQVEAPGLFNHFMVWPNGRSVMGCSSVQTC